MKNILLLLTTMVLLAGCNTTEVTPSTKPQSAEPTKLKIGMSASEVQALLGEPKTKSSETLENGAVVHAWVYRTLVKEWKSIQHTDFETIEKPNLITGEIEEVVVPVESTVYRTLYQQVTIKTANGKVISLDSEMIEDVEEAL
ncbi:MAG: hypothetical protein AB3N63_06900 [Puniceicoccaceae bacterium]